MSTARKLTIQIPAFLRPRSLRARLVLVAVTVQVLALWILIANNIKLLDQSVDEQARLNAAQVGPLMVAALIAPMTHRDYATVQEIIAQTASNEQFEYVIVLDATGKLVNSVGWPNTAALPDNSPRAHLDWSQSKPIYHTNVSIEQSGRLMGQVLFGMNFQHMAQARTSVYQQSMGIAALALAFSVFMLVWLIRAQTRRLTELAMAAKLVSFGEYPKNPLPETPDETGNVAKAFNTMTRAIDERIEQLSLARDQASQLARQASDEHARSAALLSAMDVGVLYLDATGQPFYCNPTFDALWRLALVKGQSLPDLRVLQMRMNAQLREGSNPLDLGKPHGHPNELQLQRGQVLLAVDHAVYDATGTPLGQLWMFHDMTEQKTAEMLLRQAKDAADTANRAKSTFLATMSHEIRTPMNAIMGMTQVTLESELQADQRQQLELVQSSAEHLLTIINDILDFSRIEAGKLHIDNTPFELRHFIQHISGSLSVTAQAKGLRLTHFIAPSLPTKLCGDTHHIRKVITNLLGNAIKFSKHGNISLHAQPIAAPPAGDKRLWIEFSVTDQGIGIPADRLRSIFEPFTQADNSTTRVYGGSGLGLAICEQLVVAMGGDISVRSTPGMGSRFSFRLPLAPVAESSSESKPFVAAERPKLAPSQAASHPQPSVSTPTPASTPIPAGTVTDPRAAANQIHSTPTRSLRVLLAEDNAVNEMLAVTLLNKWGHRVQVARDGQETVSMYVQADDAYDVILMDMQMPTKSGLDATREIRVLEQERGLRRVHIIAMTANAQPEAQQACLEAGMDDYVSKPLHHKRLREKLAAVLA